MFSFVLGKLFERLDWLRVLKEERYSKGLSQLSSSSSCNAEIFNNSRWLDQWCDIYIDKINERFYLTKQKNQVSRVTVGVQSANGQKHNENYQKYAYVSPARYDGQARWSAHYLRPLHPPWPFDLRRLKIYLTFLLGTNRNMLSTLKYLLFLNIKNVVGGIGISTCRNSDANEPDIFSLMPVSGITICGSPASGTTSCRFSRFSSWNTGVSLLSAAADL